MRLLASFYWLAYFHTACKLYSQGPRFYRLSRHWVSLGRFQAFWAAWFRRADPAAAYERSHLAVQMIGRFQSGGAHD